MKWTYSLLLIQCVLLSQAQSRVIEGKAICAEFPGKKESPDHYEYWFADVTIFGNDSIRLDTTGYKGMFKLDVPEHITSVTFAWVGMYPEKIPLSDNCNYLEVILLPDAIYDFVSFKKETRLRKKDRSILPKLYEEAFHRKIMKQKIPCR